MRPLARGNNSKINTLLSPMKRGERWACMHATCKKKHIERIFNWNILVVRIIEIYRDAIREKKKK
jgi:hypothetical protein